MKEYFKDQIESGDDVLFYGLETYTEESKFPNIEIKSHKGTLDTFPNLEYVRTLSNNMPLFRESK